MAPPPFRPDNAIKRAEELISVGNNQAALQSLYDFVTARRIRWVPPTAVEPVVFKFLELGVDLKKGRLIKDCLHQYKKLVQGSPEGLVSVGVVARKFIDVIETKISGEQAKEDQKQEDDDDLEGGVTPENLLTSVYQEDQSVGGFNDESITTWMRFTWDSYRTVLDLLRNNSQLEITYSGVVNRTMQFCLKHNRKNEFRRLADMLRQHLDAANYQQSKNGTNIVDLSDADTLQRYLDQRFQLVNISVKLELWHEAFRAVEDVYHLKKMSQRPTKTPILATYYQNLAKMFFVSGDQALHTVAWNKFFQLYKTNPKATEEKFTTYATTIFLSALAIKLDVLPSVGYDPQLRLYRLLEIESKPVRQNIIDSLREDEYYAKIDEDVKELYRLVECEFSVDTIKSDLAKVLPKLTAKPFFAQYSDQIRDVIVRKVFVAASTKSQIANIDELYALAALPEPMNLSHWDTEKALLQAAVEDYVSFTIDHETNTVNFVADPLESFVEESISEGEEEEEEEEDEETAKNDKEGEEGEGQAEPVVIVTRNSYIRNKLSQLSEVLHEVESFQSGSYMEKVKLARENLIEQTKNAIETTKRNAEERAKKSQEQKQKYMEENALSSEQQAEEKRLRILEERTAREAKLAEENRLRMVEKKKRELQTLKQNVAKTLIEEVNAKGHVYIDPAEATRVDLKDLRQMIVAQLSKDKAELDERMTAALKKLDYTERALRKVELPMLKKEADTMKEADLAKYNAMKAKIIESAKQEHEAKLEERSRLVSVYDDYKSLKERLLAEKEAEIGEARRVQMAKFEEAKAARIAEVREKRYKEAVAKRQQELIEEQRKDRMARQEEVARKQREIEAELERKSSQNKTAARIPVASSIVHKTNTDLDEVARKQREIEEQIEKRSAMSRAPARESATRAPATRAPLVKKTQAEFDEIARKQREMEAAIEARLSGAKPSAPTPTPPSSASGPPSGAPQKLSFAEKMRLRRQQEQQK
ncbi:translation initiation factor eIF3 core subunit a KNAG_0J02310 [Huiozyma naganishii CBS 8797]|uniref:Eukaryotic translation initiation factor 3 subunit A n=1 Tax=Huiozyma naganishii (strain ATCC MYA-139 / BCRC 22969 / CBS 8797 / KCTC 17520 / NBRC 10181 / NCYC 3082 / Yp74L-3) TaxID=1071383 RepID=J7SAM8_HUIN7|nr:hypothetical protein KNAG_0J02310 [Kazachstania naganishii CBS 8797]CCK72311.1 hypothetical protein KNAG_0J02310 [Kazachstania naganishii CBS 8797]